MIFRIIMHLFIIEMLSIITIILTILKAPILAIPMGLCTLGYIFLTYCIVYVDFDIYHRELDRFMRSKCLKYKM